MSSPSNGPAPWSYWHIWLPHIMALYLLVVVLIVIALWVNKLKPTCKTVCVYTGQLHKPLVSREGKGRNTFIYASYTFYKSFHT